MRRGPGAGRPLSTGSVRRGRRTGSPARGPFPPRALVLAWLGAAATACVSLPPDLVYEVAFAPRPQQLAAEDFYFDPEDSTTVFQRGGFRLKLRHLGDRELNEEYARFTYREPNLNPFTYGRDRDLDLGYSPPRFTVFEMTAVNQTFPKVMVDPARMTLLTDRGDRLRYWSVRKRDAPDSFEAYYMERRGQGGNEEHYFNERLGIVREALYRRNTFVFKGESYSGKVVFGPLHPGVREAVVKVEGIVLRFDAFDVPRETVEASMAFAVRQRVLKADTSP